MTSPSIFVTLLLLVLGLVGADRHYQRGALAALYAHRDADRELMRSLVERTSQSREDRARGLAVGWWGLVALQEGRCAACGRPVERGMGYLCTSSSVMVSLGSAWLDLGGTPDLLCEACFTATGAQPYSGALGCVCDACGKSSQQGYLIPLMTGFAAGRGGYSALLPAEVWLCSACLRSLARVHLNRGAREWAIGLGVCLVLLVVAGPIGALVGGLGVLAGFVAVFVGAARTIRVLNPSTTPEILFRIALGNDAKPGAVDEMGVLAGIMRVKRPQCTWWTRGQFKALAEKAAALQRS